MKPAPRQAPPPPQVREVAVGEFYPSHSDYAMSFAMGRADTARVTVRWRDGRQRCSPCARTVRTG